MIECINLSKSYGKEEVFRNFNYEFSGNFYLVIGPNGSGKTTLLNCIANYIRYSGSIKIDGKLSYLPEKRGFDDDFKVKDLINLLSKFYDTDASGYIKDFSLSQHMDKTISELSKGSKTKLYIICTLLKPASTYIFDEPTDGLDLEMNARFRKFCTNLALKKQIIVSTRDLGFIDRLIDNATMLDLLK